MVHLRVRPLFGALVLALLIAVSSQQRGVAAPPANDGVNWPQLGFDSGHSGYNSHETLINASNVGSLQGLWSFSLGFSNGPGNVVEYNRYVYAATNNGTVFALKATDGREQWSFATGTGYATSGSAPAVDNGLVFTVCNTPSGPQGICALDAAKGSLQWSYALPGSTSYAEAPPVVADNTVFFGGCGTYCAYVALSEKTGSVVWSAGEPSGCTVNNGFPPAVFGGMVYVSTGGCSDATILALDETTGVQVWSTPLLGGALAGLSVSNNVVAAVTAFAGGQGVYTLSAASGKVLWVNTGYSNLSTTRSYPGIAYGLLYAGFLGELVAFKLKAHSGVPKTIWFEGGQETSVAVANGVLFTTLYGDPVALEARKHGQILWEPGVSFGTSSFPIVVNGTVYGGCNRSVCAWALPGSDQRRRIIPGNAKAQRSVVSQAP